MVKERFTVEECKQCSSDRAFKDDKCVFNNHLGFAYSNSEIVEVLNNNGVFEDNFNELIELKIYYYSYLYQDTGKEKYRYIAEGLKELSNELYNPKDNIKYYEDYIRENLKKQGVIGK